MRILIVGGSPAHRGGLEVFTSRAGAAMVQYGGHEIGVVHTHTAYLRVSSLPLLWSSFRRLSRERSQGWEIVWLQYVNFLDLVFLFVCRMLGYKVLVTPHLGANWRSQRSGLMRFFSKRMLRSADAIGLLTAAQKVDIALPPEKQTYMTPTWLPQVAEDAVPVPHRGAKLKMMHASRLSVGKGSFLSLDLCRKLTEMGVEYHFYLAGSCSRETSVALAETISRYRLSEHVTIIGPLDEASLMKVLAQMDILLHPSTIDSYPLILLEAIACGVYPVCLDLMGSRSIVEDYCGCALPSEDFLERATDFIATADLTRLKSEAAAASRRLTGDINWQAGAARMEEVFSCSSPALCRS